MENGNKQACRGEAEKQNDHGPSWCGHQRLLKHQATPSSSSFLVGRTGNAAVIAVGRSLDHMRLPFAYKLHILLCDVEHTSCENIISWVANGTAFRIHDRRQFQEVIQPRYFRQSKISSFIRQVSKRYHYFFWLICFFKTFLFLTIMCFRYLKCYMYGFSKIESGHEGLWSYFHPDFERDNQVKALSIQRQSAARKNRNYYHHQVSSAVSSSKQSIVARSPHKKGEEAGIVAGKNDQTNEHYSTAANNQTPKCVSVVMPDLSHDFNCNIDVCRPLSGSPHGTLTDCLAILDCNFGTTLSNRGPLSLSSSERNSCQQEEAQEEDDDQQSFEGLEPRPIELMLKEGHGCPYYYPWMTKNDIL